MRILRHSIFDIFVLLIGCALSWLVVGTTALNPRNVTWIQGDNWASYVASKYWLDSSWHFPLGLNPGYGMENSTAITYTGPSYLIVIFQKLFRVNPDFQFFGIWIALNILLLIFVSFKVSLKFSGMRFHSAIFSILCVTPFFLLRVQMHFWLISFFLIFMAIVEASRIYLSGKKSTLRLVALLLLAYLINIYLLAMVILILIGGLFYFHARNRIVWKSTLTKLALSISLLIIGSIILDGTFTSRSTNFTPRSILTPSYGAHPGNILSLLNPDNGLVSDGKGWGHTQQNFSTSRISLGNIVGDYEGYSYLGFGALLLLTYAFWICRQDILAFVRNKSNLPLNIYLGLIVAFIISFRIGIGSHQFTLPFPLHLNYLLSIFRSSGRFFWIISYALLLLSFLAVVAKSSSRKSLTILVMVVVFQIVDLGPGILARHSEISIQDRVFLSRDEEMTLQQSTAGAKNIRYWPNSNFPPAWAEISYFASKKGIPTNGVATSRPNFEVMRAVDSRTRKELCKSRLQNDTLYVVPRQHIFRLDKCRSNFEQVGVFREVVLIRKLDS